MQSPLEFSIYPSIQIHKFPDYILNFFESHERQLFLSGPSQTAQLLWQERHLIFIISS